MSHTCVDDLGTAASELAHPDDVDRIADLLPGAAVAETTGGQGSCRSATARLRLTRLPARLADPVAEADRRTSAADARTALCLARGTAVDDIDPASGMDISRAAYRRTRAAWVRHLAAAGPTWHVVQACRRAGDRWRQLRPQWAAELPWPHPTDTHTHQETR